MISVTFKGVIFKYEPHQLSDMYVRVQHLVHLGLWTHLDSAYACRALREAVYGTMDQRSYHVRVRAERRGTAVTQVMEIIITDKEGALLEACRIFRAMFPTWKISAKLVDYDTYRAFIKTCRFHAGCEVKA